MGCNMRKLLVPALICSFYTIGAIAQTTPSTTPSTAPVTKKVVPKAKTTTTTPARTPDSIECSKQADAKGLHGQERIRFRANCKNKLLKKS